MPTAILVDGAFFINRFRVLYGSGHSAEDTVKGKLEKLAAD
jgi:hypothetical protein